MIYCLIRLLIFLTVREFIIGRLNPGWGKMLPKLCDVFQNRFCIMASNPMFSKDFMVPSKNVSCKYLISAVE
jgi:hypothetical protein